MRLSVVLAAWLSFIGAQAYTLGPVQKPVAARTHRLKLVDTPLKPLLSENASVIFPIDDDWDALQIRGTSPRIHPNFVVVVEPATEEDVQKTVQYASELGLPFLAVSGSHGWTKTLNNIPYGIQINMRKLNSITLDSSGTTATVGGGTLQWELNRALYARNKQTGALRGAGHNFGIVTSVELKVYDIPSNWTLSTFIYSSDKLEAVLDLVNKIDSDATRSPNLPLILYSISYQGPKPEADPYFAQFEAIGPLTVKPATNVNNVDIYKLTQNSLDSVACTRNRSSMGSGTSLPLWNTTAARAAFDIFTNLTADPRFSQSVFLLENYGMQGVQAVDPGSTSLSLEERQYPAVANPTIWWNGSAALGQADAEAYGEQIRQALFSGLPEGAKKHTYVNYAVGTEHFNQMYGYDTTRVQSLKALKKVYDPNDRFGYYNPVPLV
ncbi:hypothetical protein SLS60_010227 [Paraconiothyrium brasiliense]|uniref:FAD-binding PCMH-type domain-containing protein n=1 Tax=Paraconiothyrium brasiliense TaxID=300254 RepID=A0ABR3QQN8_9PLEO